MPKTIRLNATHYFTMKNPSRREFQQIASSHLSGNDFKGFMKLHEEYTKEVYLFLRNNTAISSDNPFRFKKKAL